MRKARGFTLVDVMACIAAMAIMVAVLWPALSRARESARRAACLNNLKQIILGIKTYTPDYDEYYPTTAEPGKEIKVERHYRDLGILYPSYVSSLEVFTCPSSGDKMPKRTDENIDNMPFRDAEAEQVSYAYGYNGEGGKNRAWTEAAPSETRVLADRPAGKELTRRSNHKMDGRNVCFADGHVRWISGKGKLLTNPDHPDRKISDKSWWSERQDKAPEKEKK